MKKLLGVLLLLIGLGVNAQVIEFEEPELKLYLLLSDVDNEIAKNSNGDNIKIDSNDDGEIEISEALQVAEIEVSSNWGDNRDLSKKAVATRIFQVETFIDLKVFENLFSFSIVHYRFSVFDLSFNLNIKHFSISSGVLINLITLNNLNLEYLNLNDTRASVDLSKNTNLKHLIIHSTPLDLLDLSQNINLVNLELTSETSAYLDSIDLSSQKELEFLSMNVRKMKNLDLSNNNKLIHLELDGSNNNGEKSDIQSIDLSENLLLEEIILEDLVITDLDVSIFKNLKVLGLISLEELDNFDVSNNVMLESLTISKSSFNEIGISNNIMLKELSISYCNIDNIDISNNKKLKSLSLIENEITSLDVSKHIELIKLYCSPTIIGLDISNNLKLEEFYGYLSSDIDFSKYIFLERLFVYNDNLQYLDLSNNPLIEYVLVSGDNLEVINLKSENFSNNNFWFFIEKAPQLKFICVDDDFKLKRIEQEISQKNLDNIVINSFCSFKPGGKSYTIKGQSSHCDYEDITIPSIKYSISNGTEKATVVSNLDGEYVSYLQEGTYTITPIQTPEYYTITPNSFEFTFPSQTDLIQDFCIVPKPDIKDVEIVIVPIGTPARPGFDTKYKIEFTNNGFNTVSGKVKLEYLDAILDFENATSLVDINNGGELTWNYTDLEPYESRSIEVRFNLNSPMETPAVNGGNILKFLAEITPLDNDLTPQDNNFKLRQTVVNSYDPNDKTCLEGNEVLPEMIGEYVHYKIRFENKGTFAAENIVVVDEIDETKFDLSTLTPLDASHEFETRIKENKVEFIFEGIQLPYDAESSGDTVNTDENNDGYIVFKIKTLPTLKLGDSFSNQASIYFDFNFPIITNNETTTIVEEHLGVSDFEFSQELILYPNPVQDRLYITSNSDAKVLSLDIYNLQGQLIQSVPQVTKMSFDVSRLTKGTYLVNVKTDKGAVVSKLVKE